MQRYALCVALIVSAVGAHAQKVKVDWDRATDFARYNTYKWTKIPSPRTPTPEIEKLIYSVVDTQLEAKGLKKVENGEPDLYVGYSVTLGEPNESVIERRTWPRGPENPHR